MAVTPVLTINTSTGQPTRATPVTVGGTAYALVALNAAGYIDPSMLQESGQVASVVASEAIAAGALVNLWMNGAALNVRNADNSAAGKEANGFSPSAISSSSSGTIYTLSGSVISGLSGLTIGTLYFLGTTGAAVATITSTTGSVLQQIGRALSATTLLFEPGPAIVM
jgi:hypothetical protein